MNTSEDLTREITGLIARFGAAAVRDEAKIQCKGDPGNKTIPDWPHLMEEFEKDARDWLAGREAAKLRTNYSIAKEFSNLFPGTREISTRKRIERKLREERKRAMLVSAFFIAERELPFCEIFRYCRRNIQGRFECRKAGLASPRGIRSVS